MADIRAAHDAVKREDWARAFGLCNHVLNEDPDSPEALYLMGATLRALGNIGLALTCLAKALSKEQKQPNLWMTYAATLHDLNKWDEAEKAFTVVHQMLPSDPMPPANIGATYVQRGNWREAINWCDRALAIDPKNHIARISKGFACLSLGRWKDAWQYSEALYGNHLNVRIYNPPEREEPEWDGSKGKTVVVQCDQGLGDQIMFAQCLNQMIEDCKEVIIECSQRMVPFFSRNWPKAVVYGTLKEQSIDWPVRHQIDAHVHISLLGKWYRNTDKEFPRKAYITPDPVLLDKWKAWLKPYGRTIGIGWKGGIQATQTHIRSMRLEELAKVINLGTAIDLSYMDNGHEISRWNIDNEHQVIRPPLDPLNYDDTISLIAALDEVVTVTTSAVHVCGALGRSAHVLVPELAQWRYVYRCGDGMIWYPDTVKLYRQKPGEVGWSFPVNRVVKDL